MKKISFSQKGIVLDYRIFWINVRLINREVKTVEVSYKKLWKILIDKEMKKKDLQSSAGISWASVTKLSKGETVSMEVLMKVCKALECNIGDIMDLIPEDKDTHK